MWIVTFEKGCGGSVCLSLGRFSNFPSLLETEAAGCSPGTVPGVRAEGLWAAGGGCVGAAEALDPPGRAGLAGRGRSLRGVAAGAGCAAVAQMCGRSAAGRRQQRALVLRECGREAAGGPGRRCRVLSCPALLCRAGPRGLSPGFVTAQRACPAHGWQRLCSLSRPPGSEPRASLCRRCADKSTGSPRFLLLRAVCCDSLCGFLSLIDSISLP